MFYLDQPVWQERAKTQRRSLIVTPETALKAVSLSVCKKIMWKQAVLMDLSYSPEEYWDRYQMFSLDLMHLPIGGNLTVHLVKKPKQTH